MAVEQLDAIGTAPARLSRRQIAWRAAAAIPDGAYVNLGIGLPTVCADHLPEGREIVLHSENGVLGLGPRPPEDEEDWDLINAGKGPVTLLAGGSYCHHTDAFVMIRGGHLDLALLGALGGLGVGGAMDLAAGAKAVWVLMEHTTKTGGARIVERCGYPLTAARVVRRIFTDLAVIDVEDDGLTVREMVPGLTLAALQTVTGPRLRLAPDWRVLEAPAP
jgi:3-oxoadipate CoA-transferase, beta subunit